MSELRNLEPLSIEEHILLGIGEESEVSFSPEDDGARGYLEDSTHLPNLRLSGYYEQPVDEVLSEIEMSPTP